MKIHEFIPEEQLDEAVIDQKIREILEDKGYKFLGAGIDQQAYLEPSSGQVLKIFGTQFGKGLTTSGKPQFTKGQKMFFFWAKYCMDRQNNPFLPKFYGFESFMFNGNPYLQIRQEKLNENDVIGLAVARAGVNISWSAHRLNASNVFHELGTEAEHDGEKWFNQLTKNLGREKTALLLSTILDLFNISDKKNWYWDLHNDNVMSRGSDFPVIVDPWVA